MFEIIVMFCLLMIKWQLTIGMRFHKMTMGGTLTLWTMLGSAQAGRAAAGSPHWLERSLFVDTKRVFDCWSLKVSLWCFELRPAAMQHIAQHLLLHSNTATPPPPTLVLQTINQRSCTITEKAPTRAFSMLKAATTALTFKNLLRHYAKQPPKHCFRILSKQVTRLFWFLRLCPKFMWSWNLCED